MLNLNLLYLPLKMPGILFVFKGQGYGHGVGLSQYGAVQMAKQGYKAEEIMKYYFKGVEIIK